MKGPVKSTSPLHVASLVALGIVLGSLLKPLSSRFDGTVPRIGWATALVLGFCAAVVALLAWSTWQALHKRKDRMTSDHGVKMLAVAKSSVIVGGLFGGLYSGVALSFVRDWDTDLGRERVLQGGAAGLAGLALLTAALLLEHALQIKDDDDEDANTSSTPA